MADAATLSKTLTNSYQETITGACMLTLEEGLAVRIHIGSSTPAVDAPSHLLNNLNSPLSYTGGLKVYARIDDKAFGTITKISYTGV